MHWFGRKDTGLDSLEERLRAIRSQPSKTLVERIATEVRGPRPHPTTAPGLRARAALVAALTVALLAAAAAFGGFSYAASGVDHSATAIAKVFSVDTGYRNTSNAQNTASSNKNSGGNDDSNKDDNNPAHHQYQEFVFICLRTGKHHHVTLRVPEDVAKKLVNKGDAKYGVCEADHKHKHH